MKASSPGTAASSRFLSLLAADVDRASADVEAIRRRSRAVASEPLRKSDGSCWHPGVYLEISATRATEAASRRYCRAQDRLLAGIRAAKAVAS